MLGNEKKNYGDKRDKFQHRVMVRPDLRAKLYD